MALTTGRHKGPTEIAVPIWQAGWARLSETA